jgi:prepilin-type N-terminal cleavage/methylation domain-containing protein
MNHHRHNAGFSLIEVMVAILILGIALVGLTRGITTGLASNKEAELQTTAALLAQGKIEELRATGGLEDGEDEGDCGADLPLYQWRQTIAATDIEGLHEVTVVVQNSRTGQAIYDLNTLLFEPPDISTIGGSRNRENPSSRKQQGGGP